MRTYISKFSQGILGYKGKWRKSDLVRMDIAVGDEVKLKGEYYISESGSMWKKEKVENSPQFFEEKSVKSNKQ